MLSGSTQVKPCDVDPGLEALVVQM